MEQLWGGALSSSVETNEVEVQATLNVALSNLAVAEAIHRVAAALESFHGGTVMPR